MAGNSWQQPVAGEPSWGSPHTHVETLVNAANPGNTSDVTVTCTNVPTGTKGIWGYATIGGVTTGRVLNIKDSSGNVWRAIYEAYGTTGEGSFFVPLNSSKQFLYNVDNADVSAVSIHLRTYFI